MLVLVWSLFAGMKADVAQGAARRKGLPAAHPVPGLSWQRRLGLILSTPGRPEIQHFIASAARPALDAVAAEMTRRARAARVEQDGETGAVALTVAAEGVRDFVYGVEIAEHKLPAFTAHEAARMGLRYEARTYFSDGSRGYDIMGLSERQIIDDVLRQFEGYLALVQSPETSLVTTAPEH
jgi:choline/glycine/proline betaine transport protein